DVERIKKGQDVTFTVGAVPNMTFNGKVERIRLNALVTDRPPAYTVEISVDNAGEKLLPFMTAVVRFPVGKKENVLLVPNDALRYRPSLAAVTAEHREFYRTLLALEPHVGPAKKPAPGDSVLIWVEDGGFVKPLRVRLGGSEGKLTEV